MGNLQVLVFTNRALQDKQEVKPKGTGLKTLAIPLLLSARLFAGRSGSECNPGNLILTMAAAIVAQLRTNKLQALPMNHRLPTTGA